MRVSTTKQGVQGVSLQEQREAIRRYAARAQIEISDWFEERETAAKRGRPIFSAMLRALRRGPVAGVVIHKIDRSARNLKDWADLGELIDSGIDVHFANESLDLHSRGGRLSADIQAVVAADFIRNLREETRKGFYGRLKQGLYPLPAPIGYLDNGRGKPKTFDPERAPLVRQAFTLYADGGYSLDTLGDELWRRGLRSQRGGRVSRNGLSTILNNPFYFGLIRLGSTGETFAGIHEPLVSKRLFDDVHARLQGKTRVRVQQHDFTFRLLLSCQVCGNHLVGEMQKGHVYYRCHSTSCRGTSVREDVVERAVLRRLEEVCLTEAQRGTFRAELEAALEAGPDSEEERRRNLELRLGRLRERLARLTDAFVDGDIEKEIFDERKNAVVAEKADVEAELNVEPTKREHLRERLTDLLELASRASLSYRIAETTEKREIVRAATSNRLVSGKDVVVELSPAFAALAECALVTGGDPCRSRVRTIEPREGAEGAARTSLMQKLVGSLRGDATLLALSESLDLQPAETAQQGNAAE